MRWDFEHTAAVLVVAASGLLVGRASMAQGVVDPTYGRISGDVCLAPGAGATIAPRGARAEGELRVRYLDAVGAFATYEDAVLSSASSDPRRVIAGGFELRPLFLYRWLRGLETQRGYVDLMIDSVGLELGAFLSAPPASPGDFRPGFQLGLGLEVPVQAQATGLWVGLHGGVRWADQPPSVASAGGPDARGAYLTITLAWHQMVRAHLVDVSDGRPE
jgi:hypothetical protein